jgi:hypothetical protein
MIQLILYIFILCSTAYAGTIDPNVPDSEYIRYASSLDYVVEIEGRCNDDTLFYGSAVLIDDHNFLTAAHVVENYKGCKLFVNRNEFLVSKVISHPDFKKERIGFADIAIGHSIRPFKIKNYPSLYDDTEEQNKICVISGYGMNGKFGTENTSLAFDRKRRAGSNMIDKIENDTLICIETNRGHDTHTVMEFMISSGDSGGPLFIDNKLAGINSVLTTIKSSVEPKRRAESAHTRISKFIKWIQENKLVRK